MTTPPFRFTFARFQAGVLLALLSCAAIASPAIAAARTTLTSASEASPSSTPRKVSELNPVLVHSSVPLNPLWQTVTLHRNGASGKQVAVTFGIPFPPGVLKDPRDVHILDEHGNDLPAHITTSLHWYVGTKGIRAVRVQMHLELDGDSRTLRFSLDAAKTNTDVAGWPYADALVQGSDGVRVPGVLATLSAQWMSASLIAGPQLASTKPTPYDRYVSTQFEWAKKLPLDDGAAWLFDRPTTLFQAYVRTGRLDYLAAASESYRFYMSHLRRTGAPGWPLCGGGWSLGKVNVCDPKYVYIEPILLAVGLTGDDSEHDDALISRMVGSWNTGGWNISAGPYTGVKQRFFTERQVGLGLLQIVSAWEITGNARYRKDIDDRLGWLFQHQQHNPDGLGNDGSWRNSWDMHEGNEYNAASDVLGSSPWMTQNIIDGLWHAWLATRDTRIPTMVIAFGRYMERYGWIDLNTMTAKEKDWRNPCSGPDGQISWYWSSAHAERKQLAAIESSDGWYSDSHNVELTLPVAAARYFTTDQQLQRALDLRMELLASSYSTSCAEISSTPRLFNWNNRGTGVVQWLMSQPAGSGAIHTEATATGH
ncbi:MAG TPA: hypothetical protein VN043_07990 [Rhodanobacter sp.]|nr:hypothetical protein [Rhodanobacter sp.]